MTVENIEGIELATRGQSDNSSWFSFRKGVVTASKGHGVKTRMKKVNSGAVVSMKVFLFWSKLSLHREIFNILLTRHPTLSSEGGIFTEIVSFVFTECSSVNEHIFNLRRRNWK